MASIGLPLGCDIPQNKLDSDSPLGAGVWVVYGSATRLSGSHEIKEAATLLRDPQTCYRQDAVSALGDIDGDGKADFAINLSSTGVGDPPRVLVFYGSGQRLSGTVDLPATAAATIAEPGALGDARAYRIGDVDGDGLADFAVRMTVNGTSPASRVVLGSATRLAGAVTLPDIGHTQLPGDDLSSCFWGTEGFATALGDLDGDGADDFSLLDRGVQFGLARSQRPTRRPAQRVTDRGDRSFQLGPGDRGAVGLAVAPRGTLRAVALLSVSQLSPAARGRAADTTTMRL